MKASGGKRWNVKICDVMRWHVKARDGVKLTGRVCAAWLLVTVKHKASRGFHVCGLPSPQVVDELATIPGPRCACDNPRWPTLPEGVLSRHWSGMWPRAVYPVFRRAAGRTAL